MYFYPYGELYCAPWRDVCRDIELARTAVHRYSLSNEAKQAEASIKRTARKRSSIPIREVQAKI